MLCANSPGKWHLHPFFSICLYLVQCGENQRTVADQRLSAGGCVGFEADDGFIRLGVAEFFAGEAFDGFRVVAESVKFQLQFLRDGFLFVDFGGEAVDFTAHAFVGLDLRPVSHADKQQRGDGHEGDDRLREPTPDAEIHFLLHACS